MDGQAGASGSRVVGQISAVHHAGFYIAAAVCFGVWWLFSNRLRHWSLRTGQDGRGALHAPDAVLFLPGHHSFALTLTLAAIMWIKGLMYEWASTMYGVWYFAASVWTTLATVYVLTMILQRTTALRDVVRENTYYMIGSLLFAFTVFWAYISFAQYFIIWNANMPEETFWYVKREKGRGGSRGRSSSSSAIFSCRSWRCCGLT
jgi:hypothetical protein